MTKKEALKIIERMAGVDHHSWLDITVLVVACTTWLYTLNLAFTLWFGEKWKSKFFKIFKTLIVYPLFLFISLPFKLLNKKPKSKKSKKLSDNEKIHLIKSEPIEKQETPLKKTKSTDHISYKDRKRKGNWGWN